MADELPVLVASVGFDQARELEEAARVGRHVWVDLKWPPGETGPHLLEVYIPSQREPLRLLAEPLGSESEKGFALRIYPWDEGDGEVTQESRLADVEIVTDRFAGRSLAGGRLEMLAPLGEGSLGPRGTQTLDFFASSTQLQSPSIPDASHWKWGSNLNAES